MIKFIADSNVGKLARWLRIMGYNTLFIRDIDDSSLVDIALTEGRIILTKDTQIMTRRAISNGRLQAVLCQEDDPKEQLRHVVRTLHLDYRSSLFSCCLECNETLVPRSKEEVKDLVPPYVFHTQTQYMQCPACHRVYWRGTHWERMHHELERLLPE